MSTPEKIVEALLEMDIDPKSIAMSTDPAPRVYGQLKPGDVLFSPETGSYERIEGFKGGNKPNYQDADGKVQYNVRPHQMVLYSQFGPAYAYGHFVQRLSAHPQEGLFDAQLVDVQDKSDEAIWRLVDEEMYKNGVSPEDLEQSRAEHRARKAAEEARWSGGVDPRERIRRMMDGE